MLYAGEEAELIWAFRRARARGNGRGDAALEFARALTGDELSPKVLDEAVPGEPLSPAWDAISSDG
jgi:hypothetical protein